MSAGNGVVYRGHADTPLAWGGELVLVEEDGQVVGPLPHIVKHSPDGFAWGYAGSGPAELARCLIIHATGAQPDCPDCGGDIQRGCFGCDMGYTKPTPAQYQGFKFDVIARLPQGEGWRLTRAEVLAWVAAHPVAEERRR